MIGARKKNQIGGIERKNGVPIGYPCRPRIKRACGTHAAGVRANARAR